jgi:hypothetical protein
MIKIKAAEGLRIFPISLRKVGLGVQDLALHSQYATAFAFPSLRMSQEFDVVEIGVLLLHLYLESNRRNGRRVGRVQRHRASKPL